MIFGSKLKKALQLALSDSAGAAKAIRSVSKEQVRSAAEADLVVQVLRLFPLPAAGTEDRIGSPLRDVVAWLQSAEDDRARAVFKQYAAAELVRIFDHIEGGLREEEEEDALRIKSDLMFLLKVVCIYAPPGGLERLHRAARSPMLCDEYLWSVILNVVAMEGHPWQAGIVDALRDPLPQGFAAVAYLDLVNSVARDGTLEHHPFDCETGVALLTGWLAGRDEDEYSYAHSAAASIPFLDAARRSTVQQLAAGHPSRDVQLEAAWAAARCGDTSGLATLQQACADPRFALKALRYLEELGAQDRIPVHTRAPAFQALAEMCEWLAHPQEFGRPPDEITQADSRELFWPPTNDRRRVWLFRYEYASDEEGGEPDIGYGMVGSVTFALFGESTAEKTAEEVYGLHCAWELELNEDRRAPRNARLRPAWPSWPSTTLGSQPAESPSYLLQGTREALLSLRLQWPDLLVENLDPATASRWLDEWSWLVSGQVAPLFLSKYGDWFLRRPDGTTEMLSVLEGTLERLATTPDDFLKHMNHVPWQEEYLLSGLIFQLHERGKVPGLGECYAFAPHPLLIGKIDVEHAMIMGIGAWQSVCAQTARGSQGAAR